ncbi:hypothetical protein E2320_001594, partial [Naja naja]
VKSQFEPSTKHLHLGAIIDTELDLVFLSQQRREDIKALAAHFFCIRMSKLLGKMISCLDIVAALSSVPSCTSSGLLSQKPLIWRFLKGAAILRPGVIHRFPSRDLTK